MKFIVAVIISLHTLNICADCAVCVCVQNLLTHYEYSPLAKVCGGSSENEGMKEKESFGYGRRGTEKKRWRKDQHHFSFVIIVYDTS